MLLTPVPHSDGVSVKPRTARLFFHTSRELAMDVKRRVLSFGLATVLLLFIVIVHLETFLILRICVFEAVGVNFRNRERPERYWNSDVRNSSSGAGSRWPRVKAVKRDDDESTNVPRSAVPHPPTTTSIVFSGQPSIHPKATQKGTARSRIVRFTVWSQTQNEARSNNRDKSQTRERHR